MAKFVIVAFLDLYKDQIQALCKSHKVRILYSFGSVNTPRFSGESDVDFLVDFDTDDPLEYADYYFDLKFKLEGLLARSVDLLEIRAMRNPYLKAKIDQSKVLIYG